MRWSEFVAQVRERGQYPTAKEAERVSRIVLSALGGHLTGAERTELAVRLPQEGMRVLTGQLKVTKPLSGAQFVDSVAARIEGATPATARWDVSSVLSVVAELADKDLLDRIIDRLPPGYALLFGRAQLTRRAGQLV
ncbi:MULTISPECIES: DUF2267 domain-containing protein [Streptomyces]|jgi:uncharacterized protein (DUF2267 family)|uniref:Uncharacterized conserved protein, DUF2267 family n=1 Tax=Streptomyces radiopugnans TaxID=403935 RepID=A0A1H9HNI0_9ACTN|nr:DUF2267 domain-containing protein [Streptomyces radiopugnans]SEQ63901.1 Uncharacterized conserved protein, DUF2267 family [Streptomyces radiopugnans]